MKTSDRQMRSDGHNGAQNDEGDENAPQRPETPPPSHMYGYEKQSTPSRADRTPAKATRQGSMARFFLLAA